MNKELHEFTVHFIKEKFMAVIACVSNGEPRSFTAWYVVYNRKLYWKSRTSSTHSAAYKINPKASLCIYDHNVGYPDDKVGVQVLGEVYQVTDRSEMIGLVDAFANKFGEKVKQKNNIDELCVENTSSTFYSCLPSKYKLVNKDFDVHMEEYEDLNLE